MSLPLIKKEIQKLTREKEIEDCLLYLERLHLSKSRIHFVSVQVINVENKKLDRGNLSFVKFLREAVTILPEQEMNRNPAALENLLASAKLGVQHATSSSPKERLDQLLRNIGNHNCLSHRKFLQIS